MKSILTYLHWRDLEQSATSKTRTSWLWSWELYSLLWQLRHAYFSSWLTTILAANINAFVFKQLTNDVRNLETGKISGWHLLIIHKTFTLVDLKWKQWFFETRDTRTSQQIHYSIFITVHHRSLSMNVISILHKT